MDNYQRNAKCTLLIVILFLVIFYNAVAALYEDETGQKDWFLGNVGKVKWASFLLTHQKKRLLVATSENVLASLNFRSGDLEWRRILPLSDPIQFVEDLYPGILTVQSGRRISLWNQGDGKLLWESYVESSTSNSSLVDALAISLHDDDNDRENLFYIVVLTQNSISLFDTRDGTRYWTLNLPSDVVWQRVRIHSQLSSQLFVIGFRLNTRTPVMIEIKLSHDKNKISTKNYELKINDPVMDEIAFCGDFVVFLDTKRENILVNRLGHTTVSSFSLQTFHISSSAHLHLKDLSSRNSFSLLNKNSSSEILFKLQTDTSPHNSLLSILYLGQQNEIMSKATFIESRGDFVLIAQKNLEFLRIVNTDTNQSVVKVFDNFKSSFPMEKIFARVVARKDSSESELSIRLALVGVEASLHYVEFTDRTDKLKVKWFREEALSGVTISQFLDLPANPTNLHILQTEFEAADRTQFGIVSAFLNRIRGQFHQLKNFILQLFERSYSLMMRYVMKKTTLDEMDHDNISEKEDELLYKDNFGFRKLILTVTKFGKVFALHSERGKILWSKYFPELELKRLFVTKKSIYYPPECALLSLNQTTKSWFLIIFNPLTGTILDTKKLSFVPSQVVLLPYRDNENRNILLFVDSNFDVHSYPESDNAMDIIKANKNSIFLYSVNSEEGIIRGFALDLVKKNVTTTSLAVMQTWQKFIGERGHIAVSGNQINIYQAAHITGNEKFDRYFYLNPNLLAIVTNASPSNTLAKSDQPSSVYLYILDVVTGNILHRAFHKFATAPLHVIQCNNWVVYQYWNTKHSHFEISVVELFNEKYLPDERKEFSSFDWSRPHIILSQTFINPYTANVFSTTTTSRGITNKWLLLGLSSGHIYALDKRILDPRRPLPKAITQEEREKGIIPYNPFIPYSPKHFINYNRTVANLRGIQTAPTVLESTSLVFSYGLDLFFTPVTPSKSYDRLSSDFNFGVLFGVITLIFVSTVIVRRLAKNRELNRKWM